MRLRLLPSNSSVYLSGIGCGSELNDVLCSGSGFRVRIGVYLGIRVCMRVGSGTFINCKLW